MRLNALFRLAFASAPRHRLTLPHTVTRRLILQKARGHPERLPRLVSKRFQALFHDSSPECFSSFPHGTSSLSVTREYLGLASGLARFTRNFTGSVLLGMSFGSRQCFVYGGLTLYAGPFAWPSTTSTISYFLSDRQTRLNDPTTPTTQRLPAITRDRFGLFRFRSPLLTESRLISIPPVTEMFQFTGFAPLTYVFS